MDERQTSQGEAICLMEPKKESGSFDFNNKFDLAQSIVIGLVRDYLNLRIQRSRLFVLRSFTLFRRIFITFPNDVERLRQEEEENEEENLSRVFSLLLQASL